LSDYPVYDPPHRKNSAFLDFESARKNKQHFLDHRAERLDALRGFLHRFEVDLALQGTGLAAVSAWFPRYGGLLAKLWDLEVMQAFYHFRPWTGRRRGLNVIFDLGLFFGECVIAGNPNCEWLGFVGAAPGEPPKPEVGIGGSGIFISDSRRKLMFDPFADICSSCFNLNSAENLLYPGGPMSGDDDPNMLVRLVDIYGEPGPVLVDVDDDV
jgi:hypothetical protein